MDKILKHVKTSHNFKDLTGQKFGRLKVIERVDNNKYGKAMWKCRCVCGNEVIVVGYHLRGGHTKSCGCLQKEEVRKRKFIDLTGQRFGRLIVIKHVYTKNRTPFWLCKCDCGTEVNVRGNSLKSGRTKSCGCYMKQRIKEIHKNKVVSKETRRKIGVKNTGKRCSEETKKKLSAIHKGRVVSKETKKKMSEACKGEKNHNWKGGITPLCGKVRDSDKYNEWRKKVFKRDKFQCQLCGNKVGGKLIAHHKILFSYIMGYYKVDTFEKAMDCKVLWDLNNGITLCVGCHKKAHKGGI